VEPGKIPEVTTDQHGKDAYASPGMARESSAANPTVVSLLDQARQQSAAGDEGRAARTLEAALRIEPRNARLWNQLARVRLDQGQYAQAANLAAKANALAGADNRLKADNWDIIARARQQLGDSRGAREAAQQAQQLR
jgi:tetratricopeptide (TPR) repeat protein